MKNMLLDFEYIIPIYYLLTQKVVIFAFLVIIFKPFSITLRNGSEMFSVKTWIMSVPHRLFNIVYHWS